MTSDVKKIDEDLCNSLFLSEILEDYQYYILK